MKKIYAIIMMMLAVVTAHAQLGKVQLSPVSWRLAVDMACDTAGVAVLVADIEPGWHLYGLELPQGGPQPTVIDFKAPSGVEFTAPLEASVKPDQSDDPDWGLQLAWWTGTVGFSRPFRITGPVTPEAAISAEATYMVCNSENCMPPATVTLKAAGLSQAPPQSTIPQPK